MYLDSDNRPPITPQLALRVAIIGGIALALFAIVFFRLWYLQVLSGDEYLAEANDNRVREIKIAAPRGEIVDREGQTMVDNRVGLAVKIAPDGLPPEGPDRDALYKNLGRVLDLSRQNVAKRVDEQFLALPFSAATVKQDVDLPVIQYVLEHEQELPGVTIERVFLRSYPHGQVGAHLFGNVGEVTQEQLDDREYSDVEQGDRVGQAGVEYAYDQYLRGRNGATRVQVDAFGRFRGTGAVKEPVQGKNLRLSVDLDTEKVGQTALEELAPTDKGAFVAMDVNDGQVLALGSAPSFDPNTFAKVIRPSDYKRLTSKDNGEPLANRATQGLYPTGSTFKLITGLAALESGAISPQTTQVDGGSVEYGGIKFENAGGVQNGTLAIQRALQVSSDVFFYRLGAQLDSFGDGNEIQDTAARLGLGSPTGIDIPAEAGGLVPSQKWRDKLFREKLTDRPWSLGDNVNLSVGQGDLQATPLQMAVAYAAVANGGTVVTPHIGMRVEDSDGRVIQEFEQPEQRQIDIDPANREAIMEGLHDAAEKPGGTSFDVFEDFPIEIAGKTGTAERIGYEDQSWYVALAPWPDPQYVVAVTIEEGGFGAEAAAPAARQILASLLLEGKAAQKEQDKVVRGSSQTR